MKTVAFVPIKLNSQRLPHKNILPISNHPLCWHICDSLLQVHGIDEIYVYCSNIRIREYIPKEVNVLIRPEWLDGDSVKGFDIYEQFIKHIDADIYVLAHTTSPFIKSSSIEKALSFVLSGSNDSAFSAKKEQTFSWYNGNPINYNLNDVPRTQDIEPVWIETSAFYIFKKEVFTDYHRRIGFNPYIQEVSGEETIDIDTRDDYDFACKIAEVMKGE